jgi:ABC-2 type transport system permease protein
MTAPVSGSAAPAPLAPARPRRSLHAWLTQNPVILKELRGRMRGARAFTTLIIFLLLMGGFVSLLYALYVNSSSGYYSGYSAGPDRQVLGKFVFASVVGTELLLMCFICPAFTVGAISGERERQTMDLLRTTLLRARTLVVGKLASALAFAALLLVAALPLQSLAFLLGGVAPEEVVVANLLLITTAFVYSAAGVYCSTIMRRTLGATILTYGLVLLDTLGLPIALMPVAALSTGLSYGVYQGTPPLWVQGVLLYTAGLLISTNPLATAVATEAILVSNQTLFYFSAPLSGAAGHTFIAPLVSPWLPWTLFSLLLGVLLVMLSVSAIRRGER